MLGVVLWRSTNTTREFELLWTPQARLQCLDLSSTWALILKLFIAELVLCIGNGWNSKPMGEEMPGTGHSTISEKYLMWQCKTKQKNQLKPTVSHINWGFILLSKTETQQALLTWDDPECEERKRSGTWDFWDGKYCNPLTRTFGFHFSPVLSIKLLKFSVSVLV